MLPPITAARRRSSRPPRRQRASVASTTKARIKSEPSSAKCVPHGLPTPSGIATVSPRKLRCRKAVISRKFKFGGETKLTTRQTNRTAHPAIPSQSRPVPKLRWTKPTIAMAKKNMGTCIHCCARPICSVVAESIIASSPQAIPATESAARAKKRFCQAGRLIPINKCGSAIVAHAPITVAQTNVTMLMNATRLQSKRRWPVGNATPLARLRA